jgi:hypothetical protein
LQPAFTAVTRFMSQQNKQKIVRRVLPMFTI